MPSDAEQAESSCWVLPRTGWVKNSTEGFYMASSESAGWEQWERGVPHTVLSHWGPSLDLGGDKQSGGSSPLSSLCRLHHLEGLRLALL